MDTPTPSRDANDPDRVALVVENDEHVQRLLRTLLMREGFHVILARTAKQALQISSTATIAVAVVEIELPDSYGTNLIEQLRSTFPELRAVFVTASADVESLRGVDPSMVLTKPFHPDQLIRLVRKIAPGRGQGGGPALNEPGGNPDPEES